MMIAASPALVAEEVMKRMFWTPLIDCSNGIRTDSTRTLALAPGKEIETITVGGAMLGNCAIGRRLIPTTPRNRRMIEMTIANAGRWRIFENMAGEHLLLFGVVSVGQLWLLGAEFLMFEGLLRLNKLVFHLSTFLNLPNPFENDLVRRFK